MKFSEICAEVLVSKFTRAEVRLPALILIHFNTWLNRLIQTLSGNCEFLNPWAKDYCWTSIVKEYCLTEELSLDLLIC